MTRLQPRTLLALTFTIVISLTTTPAAWSQTADKSISEALVKIYTTANPPDLTSPWQRIGTSQMSGSGVITEGARILTNAHVIADYVSVEVKRFGSTKRYPAVVSHIGHECDLAILTVEDPGFFKGVNPIPLGDLPAIQQAVDVYGFPLGGETISVTSGVVSRVELGTYIHSFRDLLRLQIDAAINSGNSGGPLISGGALVGIAMQNLEDSENIGYAVPPPVIRHFLEDIQDGNFDGFPMLGADCQDLENPGLRRSLQMLDSREGALVVRVDYGTDAWKNLEFRDVILEVDGRPVANDMTVQLRGQERVEFHHLFHMRQPGEASTLKILRDGKVVERTLKVSNYSYLVPPRAHATRPSYLIFGGLVFQPLNIDLLLALEEPSEDLLTYAYYRNVVTPERQEIVVLTKVLAAPLNTGYHEARELIVTTVNGVAPRSFRHFCEMLDSNSDEWLEILTENGNLVVLNTQEARKANARILEAYGVGADRSPDLVAEVLDGRASIVPGESGP